MPKAVKPEPQDAGLEGLLEFLKDTRGFDFTGYKRSTLARRIQHRMQEVGISEYERYRDLLDSQPSEAGPLFNAILINVTSFFRDVEAWDHVAAGVVPAILGGKQPDEPVRIWSTGCASGQEPYTVAMVLAEAMGIEGFIRRVKIYATDLDEDALEQARRARYDENALEPVPPDLRAKYFQSENGHFIFHPQLRRSVIFGRHDLMDDAPMPHLDLLICRNTLMYFNAEAQSRIVERLHFALEPGGYLFLGRAEMLLTHGDLFAPVEIKHRLFSKRPLNQVRLPGRTPVTPSNLTHPLRAQHHHLLRDVALDAAPIAQIALDPRGRLTLCNARAQALFGLSPKDLDKPLKDLEISYRPLELRSLLEQVGQAHEPVERDGVEHRLAGGEPCVLNIRLTPFYRDGVFLGTGITFADVTEHHQLRANVQRFAENLETAYEELQSANEELETTNEELQSANEELETTNEELQAANEEMETMNEELRATNDELGSTNDQLRKRETELEQSNGFLRSIVESLDAGVAVLDDRMRVVLWNGQSAEMWGLRAEEVEGKEFLSMDIGLPVGELAAAIRACLDPGAVGGEITVRGHNRRGRELSCRVTFTPLAAARLPDRRAILLMHECE